MSTYYIVCIVKHPTHQDPHNRIQYMGVSPECDCRNLDTKIKKGDTFTKLKTEEVISKIKEGDTFLCDDKQGKNHVKCIVKTHNSHEYVTTEPDGIEQNNLLAKRTCQTS